MIFDVMMLEEIRDVLRKYALDVASIEPGGSVLCRMPDERASAPRLGDAAKMWGGTVCGVPVNRPHMHIPETDPMNPYGLRLVILAEMRHAPNEVPDEVREELMARQEREDG